MDKNSITGLIIIFLILIGFSYYLTPSEKERAAQQHYQDSLIKVEQLSKEKASISKSTSDTTQAKGKTDSIKSSATQKIEPVKAKGMFGNAFKGTEQYITMESDLVKMTLSNKGGAIKKIELKGYKTFDKKPLVLYDSDTALFSFALSNQDDLFTRDLFFEPVFSGKTPSGSSPLQVTGNDSIALAMRLYPNATDTTLDKSRYIEFRYVLKGNDYMSSFVISTNGINKSLAENINYLNLDMAMHTRQLEKSLDNERNATTIYYKYLKDEVDYIGETKYETQSLKTKVKWISFKQQFFAVTFIADQSFGTAEIKTFNTGDTNRYVKSMSASILLPISFEDANSSLPMKIYMGPNKYKTYKHYGLGLERQIPLGWSFFLLAWINRYAVIPVFDMLSSFNLNYGIIILILTILLKIVLFPIAYKTYMSSAKMRVLKPEVEEINKKFPKKEDALKKQQATMDMYRKVGVNPMSGCLPMLLQMPILIAMFRFFPASIELRQQPFLWADDLSSYDSILTLPFKIPWYGDHVSLFCLLMTISTLIYTKISNDMMSTGSQQMPGMKTMMYLMPIMFLGFFNSYSSGLSYYYLLANLITFAQMYIIRKVVNEDKIHAQIQENKKKPVKKSGFQKRLEEMAKKSGYSMKK